MAILILFIIRRTYNYKDLNIWKINVYLSLRMLKQLTSCSNLFFKKFQVDSEILIVMDYMWAKKKKINQTKFFIGWIFLDVKIKNSKDKYIFINDYQFIIIIIIIIVIAIVIVIVIVIIVIYCYYIIYY